MKPACCLLAVVFAALTASLAAQTTPLRIEQTYDPQFPAALALSPISEGEATIVISVDATGRLVDWLVTGYTNRAFADEAVDALRRWRYTAATEHGQPVGIRTELKFNFEAQGRVVSLMAIEVPEIMFDRVMGRGFVTRVCRPRELDQPVVAMNPTSPINPHKAAGASAQPRTVVVDFYVDEKGQPRMPVVVDSPHEVLSQAAVLALNQWRFTAPTRAGKPVSVRVRQEFIFPASS